MKEREKEGEEKEEVLPACLFAIRMTRYPVVSMKGEEERREETAANSKRRRNAVLIFGEADLPRVGQNTSINEKRKREKKKKKKKK